MIIQALVKAYDSLAADGRLDKPGWLEAKVSWSLELDEDGRLKRIYPVGQPDKKGKRTVCAMMLPEMVKRSSGVAANFLCDNAMYMLGMDIKPSKDKQGNGSDKAMHMLEMDSKGKKARALECYAACAELHSRLLDGVDSAMARAICRFFQEWDAEHAEAHPLVAPILDELKSGNLVFSMNEVYAQDVPEIRVAWDRAYGDRADAPHGRCLVTGENGPIAKLHPSIKGVAGAQATGASLVSFNGAAYESYGRMEAQGLNAPVGERAAFAYGAALNYMLREPDYSTRLGSTTVVYWAEGAERPYSVTLAHLLGKKDDGVDQTLLKNVIRDLRSGRTAMLDGVPLKPDNRFYFLGLAPNASRLSVRFFLQNSVRAFAENLHAHQERMEIVHPEFDTQEELPVWDMLNETANPKSTDKKPPDGLVGEVMRAILMNTPYPASLFAQVEVRIRAEQAVKRGKAAIIKAYLQKNVVRNQEAHPMREVLTVKLNEETSYAPYVLGRLFAVLEGLQQAANPGINTTIRDRYFNSACATPTQVFPTLVKLAQNHLNKLDGGLNVYYDKQLANLCGRLTESLPKHLTLEEQGVFQLGYYHQRQALFTKKEDKENG